MINYVCRGALIENNAPPLTPPNPALHFTPPSLHSLSPPPPLDTQLRAAVSCIGASHWTYTQCQRLLLVGAASLAHSCPLHSHTPAVIIKESKNGAARKIAIKCKIADVNDAGSGSGRGWGRGSPKSAGCQDTYAQRGRERHRQSHHRHSWQSLLLLLLFARKNKLIATRGVGGGRKEETETETSQGAAEDEQSHCGSLNSQSMQEGGKWKGKEEEGRGKRRRDFKQGTTQGILSLEENGRK